MLEKLCFNKELIKCTKLIRMAFIISSLLNKFKILKQKFFENCSNVILYKFIGNKKSTKKNLVWHSHNFLFPFITVEDFFIISITFIFNLCFPCFVVYELPDFIVFVNNFLT